MKGHKLSGTSLTAQHQQKGVACTPPYSHCSSPWLDTSLNPLHQFPQQLTGPFSKPIPLLSCQKTNLAKSGEFFARLVSWIQSVRFPVGARASARQALGLRGYEQQCGGGGERRRCKTSLVASCKLVSSASCLTSPSGWIQWIPQASITIILPLLSCYL